MAMKRLLFLIVSLLLTVCAVSRQQSLVASAHPKNLQRFQSGSKWMAPLSSGSAADDGSDESEASVPDVPSGSAVGEDSDKSEASGSADKEESDEDEASASDESEASGSADEEDSDESEASASDESEASGSADEEDSEESEASASDESEASASANEEESDESEASASDESEASGSADEEESDESEASASDESEASGSADEDDSDDSEASSSANGDVSDDSEASVSEKVSSSADDEDSDEGDKSSGSDEQESSDNLNAVETSNAHLKKLLNSLAKSSDGVPAISADADKLEAFAAQLKAEVTGNTSSSASSETHITPELLSSESGVLPGPSTPETSIVAPSNATPTQPTPPIAPPPSAPTQPAAAAAAPKMPPPQSEAQMKALGRPSGMRAHAPFAAVPGPVTPRECKASCGCNCTQLRKPADWLVLYEFHQLLANDAAGVSVDNALAARKDAYELHVLLAQLEAASRSVGEAMAVTEKLILAGLNNVTQPPPVTAKMNTAQLKDYAETLSNRAWGLEGAARDVANAKDEAARLLAGFYGDALKERPNREQMKALRATEVAVVPASAKPM